AAKPSSMMWPRNINPLHVVVVFTKWKGEAPGETLAPPWSAELFNGRPGSVDDYFDAVSFGQYKVTGEYYHRVIEMPHDDTYYTKSDYYTPDIIKILDETPDFNYAKYDNDGLDGIPNSGDDDGYVDYIILMPRSRPYDFIYNNATGVMSLDLAGSYKTNDLRPFGEHILVDAASGCIAVASNKLFALGTIVAEISHAFGTLDLMDKEYNSPENDSAGAGYWDVLAWGVTGWAYSGIPMAPGAYNRMRMNCIGINNVNLVDLYGVREEVRIKPSGEPDGKIYRAWLNENEYFLIEHRSNTGGFFYDMQIPQSGLLIWHINEDESNSTEETKQCDLECPDGRYLDRGYPLGRKPGSRRGGDNLDFWSHDAGWNEEYAGNLGDATDVFDGVTYTEFSDRTNPNPHSDTNPTVDSGIEITNIRRQGEEMVFDCKIAYRPAMQPPPLPIISMGYQRSKPKTPARPEAAQKTVFLVSLPPALRPNLLATLSPDSLIVREIGKLTPSGLHHAIMNSLATGDFSDNFEVVRDNITPEQYSALLEEYGLHPEDTGIRSTPRSVQMIYVRKNSAANPSAPEIFQNHPNPFNAETIIPYRITERGPAVLEVFNILGQKVLELDQGIRERGSHTTRLRVDGIASGVYLYRLRGSAFSQAKRFVLIR
ncbi:MAG: T9SS type A sorting domain-containing protein, partial [Candidatus Latescibacterota bacterium]